MARMTSWLRRGWLFTACCWAWLGSGCSSEALDADKGETGGTSDGGESEPGSGGRPANGGMANAGANTGGRTNTGGSGDLPDYSTSECYGKPRSTLIYSGETHMTSELVAACRGETSRVRVYVADDLFGTRVTQQEINGFLHRYELIGSEKSFRPDLGVLPTDEAVFGALSPGLIDGDKLPIFVIDTQNAGDGYLCSWCSGAELHLDGTALDPLSGDTALSIAAHESFHAIHRGYDPNELMWVDETLAEAAMSVNGYYTDRAVLNDYARNPNINWGPARSDISDYHYGAGLAFGTWLWEFGGEELMRAITSNTANSWAGIDAALEATGHAQTGLDAFLEMAAALYLDAPERGYGFDTFDLVDGVTVEELAAGASVSGTLQPFGLVYYAVGEGIRSLRVEAGTSVRGRLLAATNPVELTPIELGADLEVPADGRVLILTAASNSTAEYTVTVP